MKKIKSIEYLADDKKDGKVAYDDGSHTYFLDNALDRQMLLWLDGKTIAYDDWDKIVSYEGLIEQYEIDLQEYAACFEYPVEDVDCGDRPIKPPQPKGYYTQEEVDESLVVYRDWVRDQEGWDLNKVAKWIVPDGLIKQLPVDLPVQTMTAPNIIAPYTMTKSKARAKITAERDAKYSDMTVLYKGYTLDAHKKARDEFVAAITNILLSKVAGLKDGFVTWTTADDEDIDFTYTEIIEIGKLIMGEYHAIHLKSRANKKELKTK